MIIISPCQNERGAALVISLMFIAILAMLGATAVVLTTTDIQIGANYKASVSAFQNADAGLNYAIAKMEAGLKANPAAFVMPTNIGDPTDTNDPDSVSLAGFPAPTGFNFSYKAPGLTKIAEKQDAFTFTTVGLGPDNSIATIQTTFRRKPGIQFGAFGDVKLDLGNTAAVYSYSHEDNPTPVPADSTGEGDVGSIQSVILRKNSIVDGEVALGEDAGGTDGTMTNLSGIPIVPEDIDRVDPDPLGVVGGEYASKFTTYSSSNDNSLAVSICGESIDGSNNIDLGSGDDLTLKGKSGGANYYINDITLGGKSVLYIDTTNGPVNIYLTGEIDAITGSEIVNISCSVCSGTPPLCSCCDPDPSVNYKCSCCIWTPNLDCSACMSNPNGIGSPSDFAIFANSQSGTDTISIGNSVSFSGLIYAPYITVSLNNSADIYGAIVGREVVISNGVNIYYDTDLADDYTTNDLILTSWRDVRN